MITYTNNITMYINFSIFKDVFAVVSPVDIEGTVHYSVEWCTKPGVPPFRPYESNPPIYEHGEDFKERFLTKCKSICKISSPFYLICILFYIQY